MLGARAGGHKLAKVTLGSWLSLAVSPWLSLSHHDCTLQRGRRVPRAQEGMLGRAWPALEGMLLSLPQPPGREVFAQEAWQPPRSVHRGGQSPGGTASWAGRERPVKDAQLASCVSKAPTHRT